MRLKSEGGGGQAEPRNSERLEMKRDKSQSNGRNRCREQQWSIEA
jgi:hypothetical protein